MYKPLIGLTPSHDIHTDDISMRSTYLNAVKHAGGIPIVLPLEAENEDLQQFVSLLDGILFTGGPDVHPFLFGEETHAHCGEVSAKRDSLELALLRLAMEKKMPILGICRGIQLINIGLGGTIYQDIPIQFHQNFPVAHKQPFSYSIPSHTVSVVSETKLAEICQSPKIRVNSMHHQAVKDPAPGCIVSGIGPEGLTEALEMPDYPFLVGVQWHPEHLWKEDPAASNLFIQFIKACRP